MSMSAPRVRRWPEAEQLFRADPRWLGGDDAYSVVLGPRRRLWLFGDSFIDPTGAGDRRAAALINNSVAVQQGSDPATATMAFTWGTGGDGRPQSLFTDPDPGVHLWPGDAALVDGTLVLFFMRIRPVAPRPSRWRWFEAPANFAVVGWSAATIDRPGRDPAAWEPQWARTTTTAFARLVGSGGVFVADGHLYAHAVSEGRRAWPRGGEHLLARWPVGTAAAGELGAPEWWAGPAHGWVPQPALQQMPAAVTGPGLTEFTVHHEAGADRYVRTELVGFTVPRIRLRHAPAPEGPWSRPRRVHRPGQVEVGRVFCYAGKAHVGLAGADLLVTYNSNGRDLETVLERDDLYRPHCLAVDLS